MWELHIARVGSKYFTLSPLLPFLINNSLFGIMTTLQEAKSLNQYVANPNCKQKP